MDIKVATQLSPVAMAPDAARAAVARGPQSDPPTQANGTGKRIVERAIETAARERADAVKALQGTETPSLGFVRAQLDVDEASRRVVARIFNRETGEFVRQIPDEDKLRLWGLSRAQFGHIFKADV